MHAPSLAEMLSAPPVSEWLPWLTVLAKPLGAQPSIPHKEKSYASRRFMLVLKKMSAVTRAGMTG